MSFFILQCTIKKPNNGLLERGKGILTPTIYEQGLDSLTLEKDDTIVAQWMVNFISG